MMLARLCRSQPYLLVSCKVHVFILVCFSLQPIYLHANASIEMTISHSLVQDISSTSLQYHVQCLTSVYVPDRVSWFVNGEPLGADDTAFSELIDTANNIYQHSALVHVELTNSAVVTCDVSFGTGCDFSKSVTIAGLTVCGLSLNMLEPYVSLLFSQR